MVQAVSSATQMQGSTPFLQQTPAAQTASGAEIYNVNVNSELSQVVQTDPSLSK